MNIVAMDTSSEKSRKRQRSVSSIPECSSPKRAASEDPADSTIQAASAPRVLGEKSDEISTYMLQQDESSPANPDVSTEALNLQAPSDVERLDLVLRLMQRPMEVGETWYIVSRNWFKKWQAACQGVAIKDDVLGGVTVGPVDNVPLLNRNGILAKPREDGIHFELLPQDAWQHLLDWYGPCQYPLPRKVIPQGVAEVPIVEIYPPVLKLYRLSPRPNTMPSSHPTQTIVVSKRAPVQKIIDTVNETWPAADNKPQRFWKVDSNALETDPEDVDGLLYPASRLRNDGAKLFGATNEERLMTLEDALWDHGDAVILETRVREKWISELEGSATTPPAQFASSSQASSSRLGGLAPMISYANGSLMSRAKAPDPKAPGTVGLTNMGNTCFMNSALQCLAHTPELTEYFLTGVYRNELNPSNPLGMGGAIARAFGALLEKLWSNTALGAYAPREFKQQLQKFAPSFSGYQQHDSQELLAFLLDGLHEDLNRVLKKPYVENPDWDGGGVREMLTLAKTTWEGYMKRNDSVIVDLFQGQYKSTLVCPECEKVSITFDPFMYLTLPLPVDKMWRHTLHFVPFDSRLPHLKIPIEVPNQGTFKDLKAILGRWLDIIPDNLCSAEIYNHRFYKFYDDEAPVTDVGDKDLLAIFELPCSARQSRESQQKLYNEDEDYVVIPVFHRVGQASTARTSFISSSNNFGYPLLVALSPEAVKSEEAIYAAIVQRYERWTTATRDLYRYEGVPHSEDETIQSASVTEIRENGDIVETEDEDIVDMNHSEPDSDVPMNDVINETSVLGPQTGLFEMTLFSAVEDKMETGWQMDYNGDRIVSFAQRAKTRAELPKSRFLPSIYDRSKREDKVKTDNGLPPPPVVAEHPLLRHGDAIVCNWDSSFHGHFFGDRMRDSTSLFDSWKVHMHPELQQSRDAQQNKQKHGISIEDCLDEFTREEKLGEQDLWYCPRCKKHQEATKKFELWKVPDVLVVHLKRFSSSRLARDKIDDFVDFPVDGLDLEARVGERQVAKSLVLEGIDLKDVGIGEDLEEPLLYDLFAVDEHMGGLGGGHYRAYAKNHLDNRWYHFDDSYVLPARASDAVTASAYLLFYRRRTSRPIGGKTYELVEAVKQNEPVPASSTSRHSPTPNQTQLPTPPLDGDPFLSSGRFLDFPSVMHPAPTGIPRIMDIVPDSPFSSPSVPAEDPPTFMDSLDDVLISETHGLDIPPSISRVEFHKVPRSGCQLGYNEPPSPSSSNEAEHDFDDGDNDATSTEQTSRLPAWPAGHFGNYSPQSQSLPYTPLAADDIGWAGTRDNEFIDAEGMDDWSRDQSPHRPSGGQSPSTSFDEGDAKVDGDPLDQEFSAELIPPSHPESQSPEGHDGGITQVSPKQSPSIPPLDSVT